MKHCFQVQTHGPGLYDITDRVVGWCRDSAADGLLTLFIQHTSASLLIQENADPDVRDDLQAFFTRLVPPADHPAMSYLQHTIEGPDDMPAHIKAAWLPVSLSIPVIEGRPALGQWQGIYVYEHRTTPHRRNVVAMLSAG